MASDAGDAATALVAAVEQVVRGRRPAVELSVAAVIAGGHVLIEDVPGSGKTTLARALAHAVGGTFRRVQGTADLLPADVTGSSLWMQSSGSFTFVPGPVFTNVLLVDELNRIPPRTQSALLEAMDEGTVTVDGTRHALPDPFVLIATQNPFEQWGTYPLPEGQLDRFSVMVHLGANDEGVERQVVREQLIASTVDAVAAVMTPEELVSLRAASRAVHVADSVVNYAVALTAATRAHPHVGLGASTRATLALIRCAQAMTLLRGGRHVCPDDVKAVAPAVLAHRLVLRSSEAGIHSSSVVVADVLASEPVPLIGA